MHMFMNFQNTMKDTFEGILEIKRFKEFEVCLPRFTILLYISVFKVNSSIFYNVGLLVINLFLMKIPYTCLLKILYELYVKYKIRI